MHGNANERKGTGLRSDERMAKLLSGRADERTSGCLDDQRDHGRADDRTTARTTNGRTSVLGDERTFEHAKRGRPHERTGGRKDVGTCECADDGTGG